MAVADLNQVRQLLFLDKNLPGALELLLKLFPDSQNLPEDERIALIEMLAIAYEQRQQYSEAAECYGLIQDYYQAGYCWMLHGDSQKAMADWKHVLARRNNHWCISLHGMITGTLSTIPTFLQIRNHIEADIVHLYHAKQLSMLENFLRYIDFLAEINYETYKFVGRALFNVGQYPLAGQFLIKGQRLLPNDPEIYYHLGQYYQAINHFPESSVVLKQCILISPTYTPAIELLERIQEKVSSGSA